MADCPNFLDFLNNENPYAFLRDYQDHPFKKENIKIKLDALQKIQPKFIPCVLDEGVLTNERTSTINFVIRNGLNENIMRGVEILDHNNIVHDIYNYKLVNQSSLEELNTKAIDLKDIGFDNSFVDKDRYNFAALNYIVEVFKKYIDLENMEDVILNICRLKLINKQKILREKVYTAIQEKMNEEAIMKINLESEFLEDSLEEAEKFYSLKKKFSDYD